MKNVWVVGADGQLFLIFKMRIMPRPSLYVLSKHIRTTLIGWSYSFMSLHIFRILQETL